ncbi:hypothetical protein L207DRAFT_525750 [Hyaloscypha variabilis F]|uniref:Uncharacterized protein n=1 Tax=Hyaloscypha variabilis (strain UAMH 11265 / GT02V1 / F) TaxID=1149755 RepID=A0A2J6S113_HYAVF|nr:hypothetical protein L207DRAFT_525750 [Hyaloscypha variabilis F]
MPARELGSSIDAPNGHQGVGTTLLRKHKILPHPREVRFPEVYPLPRTTKPRDLVIDTGNASISSSDASSPRTLKHTSKRIGGLPPTPPTHSRQSSGSHPTITIAPKFDVATIRTPTDIPSAPSTPLGQQSPPTPDVTPPRAMPLSFRPPGSDRYSSSRTDSFKTAREHQESSDEDEVSEPTVRPAPPSARTSAVEVPQVPQKSQKRKEVGLGLGLESDNEGATTPRAKVDRSQEEFVVFDGEWGSTEEVSEVEREWDDNLMRNVTVRKRHARKLQMFTDGPTGDVLEDDVISPTAATKVVRSLPLQERIARHRSQRDASDQTPTGSGKFGDRRVWPTTVVNPESPSTPDVRRFSAMSGRSVSSTVIEAMVVDTPPTRRKTLRHSKKQLGLRDFSSDQSTITSGPNSVVSIEAPHRLHHSMARIPEKRHRSLASNTTMSTNSSSGRSRREVLKSGAIPVVVIPDRRSSTKSSRPPSLRSTSSRRTKRSMSLNSAPLSQSSKYNDPGYFDTLPPRKRTMSESAGSGHSVRTIDFPPNIPARRSSLSAPTSRNTSRAGSLTAESLRAHNMIQAQTKAVAPEPAQSQPSPEEEVETDNVPPLNVDHNGDPFFGKRLSTQVTPFSQASYETAGTMAEVSEAMAVSIFPHQNKSVLVVQQKASSDPSPPNLKAIDTIQQPKVNGAATIGPVTPPQPIHPMDEIDSPLRNPRAPPEPPAIKFIPPTPAALAPGAEEERQLGYNLEDRPSTSDDKPKRGMSLMRRAFSNRRNSESAAHQPGLFKRTFSLSNTPRRDLTDHSTQTSKETANPSTLYPSVADRPADGSKLHPFWRPAHFWDDLEDHESDEEDEFSQYPIVENRPPPPKRSFSQKLKRTFAILPIQDDDYDYQPYALDRRTMRRTPSGNMRVVKQRSNSSLRRGVNDRRQYTVARPVSGPAEGSFGYGFKEGNGGRVHTIPGLGIRIEYIGWSGMRRRLSERRREQRSEKLRASISGPKGVQSGVDDVLRTRTQ